MLNTLYAGIYLWFAFRRAYGTTLFGALWRTLVIGVAYWLVTIATLLAIWLPPVVGIFNRV